MPNFFNILSNAAVPTANAVAAHNNAQKAEDAQRRQERIQDAMMKRQEGLDASTMAVNSAHADYYKNLGQSKLNAGGKLAPDGSHIWFPDGRVRPLHPEDQGDSDLDLAPSQDFSPHVSASDWGALLKTPSLETPPPPPSTTPTPTSTPTPGQSSFSVTPPSLTTPPQAPSQAPGQAPGTPHVTMGPIRPVSPVPQGMNIGRPPAPRNRDQNDPALLREKETLKISTDSAHSANAAKAAQRWPKPQAGATPQGQSLARAKYIEQHVNAAGTHPGVQKFTKDIAGRPVPIPPQYPSREAAEQALGEQWDRINGQKPGATPEAKKPAAPQDPFGMFAPAVTGAPPGAPPKPSGDE